MSDISSSSLPSLTFESVLIANRGEIAVRLIKAVQSFNIKAVAVFTEADSSALHVSLADKAISLPPSSKGYTDIAALVSIAKDQSCGAVLPGYGFISENADAAQAFEENGVTWIGPTPNVINLFGLKHLARDVASSASIPLIPGSSLCSDVASVTEASRKVGLPVLIKASAGGGGMGQGIAYTMTSLNAVYNMVVQQAKSLFDSNEVYVERYISNARHIEVQVFGDGEGTVVALGERDCSAQRRRQKVIEEAPAPELDISITQNMRQAAVQLCEKHKYRSAGTVEFLLDVDSSEWYFLEVNTRLQVEHGVTEMITGIDIVRWMLLLADGKVDLVRQYMQKELIETGCAFEARVIAENPVKDFAPCPGTLLEMQWPKEGPLDEIPGTTIRVDAWARRGTVVSSHFDPLLGKVLAWGRTRNLAIAALRAALLKTVVRGVPSNVELLLQITETPEFVKGKYTTGLISSFTPRSTSVEVLSPGLQSSIQDYPGRVGYWDIGVSPSGAMDAYAMGMANALVGNNPVGTAALEMTLQGPVLKFHTSARIALTGARMNAELDDGKPVPWWTSFNIDAGSVLTLGRIADDVYGKVSYLAVQGGVDAPKYLGSSSTFPTGKFGGIHGGFLTAGDFLPLVPDISLPMDSECYGWAVNESLPKWLIPRYESSEAVVGALNGPHGSTDFFAPESLDTIWNTSYKVHHAANRLGVRLIGPTPKWTRKDGGSAGLHPSNLYDYTYAPGAVNFSGNTPIVLMLDGPSLGGFVCPITVATCELWKVAQASPESTIRFKQIQWNDARSAYSAMIEAWEAVRLYDKIQLERMQKNATWSPDWVNDAEAVDLPAIVMSIEPDDSERSTEIKVVYRMSGDEHILIEYGEVELDLVYRMRIHMVMEQLKSKPYIKELCPGVRSLLVKYDPSKMPITKLLDALKLIETDERLGSTEDVVVPSRLLRLPLAFNDRWTQEAQERYLRSVRSDAPYMPSNIEFIKRINGFDSIDEIRNVITSCQYCVMGLGDVYLGAPCAVPIDPRHRLVTSKYNPARTYTPEGAVGIGGAFMCIYGMDSPGGYQLCGRTLPIWDNYGSIPKENRGSPPHIPWLLRFFDRVQYYLVSDDELEILRERYRRGALKIEIRDETFSYRDHKAFLEREAKSIADFREKQQAAFSAERARWEETGEGENNAAANYTKSNSDNFSSTNEGMSSSRETSDEKKRPPFSIPVFAGLSASVWSIEVENGSFVNIGDRIIVLESMKVEVAIEAPVSGTVMQLTVQKGDAVTSDKEICIIVSSRHEAMKHLGVEQLRKMYKLGVLTPKLVFEAIESEISSNPEISNVFTWNAPYQKTLERIELLQKRKEQEYLPLFGLPFVVSDDIDIAGVPTTAGCRGLKQPDNRESNIPQKSAPIVETLEEAGAILIGKGNMDQLGASLTGTFSSWGIATNPIDSSKISGGSFGTSIAIAKGLATFGISVDTFGTSMIPPALTGVLGLKTSQGLIALDGISPSLPSQDCISIIATVANDLWTVLQTITSANNSFNSTVTIPRTRSTWHKFFVGTIDLTDFDANKDVMDNYEVNVQTIRRLGATSVPVTSEPFLTVSKLTDTKEIQQAGRFAVHKDLLKSGPEIGSSSQAQRTKDNPFSFLLRFPGNKNVKSEAEKGDSSQPFTKESSKESEDKQILLEPIHNYILGGSDASASNLAAILTNLESAYRLARTEVWSKVDAIALPAVFPNPFSVSEAQKNHQSIQSKMGTFTRIVTSMNLCAVTLNEGIGKIGGLLLIAPAGKEAELVDIAEKWQVIAS